VCHNRNAIEYKWRKWRWISQAVTEENSLQPARCYNRRKAQTPSNVDHGLSLLAGFSSSSWTNSTNSNMVTVWNLYLGFCFIAISNGIRKVEVGTEIVIFCMIHFYYSLKMTNMATVRNFEAVTSKLNIMGIRTNENHCQEWITEW
jgi:hypothetical protein